MPAKKTAAKPKAKPEAKTTGPVLVKMVRDSATADVHPAEVENFRSGGWVEA